MITEIIDGISSALYEEFGEGTDIYVDDIPQGFAEPCFSVQFVTNDSALRRPDRYERTNDVCIYYFPADKVEPKAECYRVEDTLYECLEYIHHGSDLIRGSSMHAEYDSEQNVLRFFVSYDFFVKRTAEKDPMTDLSQSVDVKGG